MSGVTPNLKLPYPTKTDKVTTGAKAVQDLAEAIDGQTAYVTYTPTISNFTLGNGTAAGRYVRFGNLISVSIDIRCGTTTAFSGDSIPVVTLPFETVLVSIGSVSLQGSGTDDWWAGQCSVDAAGAWITGLLLRSTTDLRVRQVAPKAAGWVLADGSHIFASCSYPTDGTVYGS